MCPVSSEYSWRSSWLLRHYHGHPWVPTWRCRTSPEVLGRCSWAFGVESWRTWHSPTTSMSNRQAQTQNTYATMKPQNSNWRSSLWNTHTDTLTLSLCWLGISLEVTVVTRDICFHLFNVGLHASESIWHHRCSWIPLVSLL